jgi:integrase
MPGSSRLRRERRGGGRPSTDPAKVGELMRVIEGYGGYRVSQAALRLAPLVFVRPGELRKARWPDERIEQLTSKL